MSVFKELYNYRQLLYMIAWREIKIKYKQSIMGFLWAIFMPMVIVSAGILVRYAFSKLQGTELTLEEIVTVSIKAIPWAFFVSALRFSSNSLIGNANLVTKIYFPKEIFPIAAVSSQLLDFTIATILLTIILIIAGIGGSIYLLWLPVILFILILLIVGLGLLFSTASLFFRDVKYIVEVILTFAIFFTPVFYEVNEFGAYANWLLVNPVAPILESINNVVVLQQNPPLIWLGYSALFAVVLTITSYQIFKKAEPAFAESI